MTHNVLGETIYIYLLESDASTKRSRVDAHNNFDRNNTQYNACTPADEKIM